MNAVQMTAPGSVDVLQTAQMSDPEIQTGTQIKVRLKAAGVNPVDTKLRSRGLFYPDALPAVLGLDGAGVVEAVGDEVTRFRPGDAVWYCNAGLGGDPGNYAEFHLVDELVAQSKPSSIDFIQAAAAPLLRDLSQARDHQGEILSRCGDWIDAGKLKIRIAGTYLLEQAAEAHRRIEEGRVQGKLVLTL